jgi:ABC-2 type transport system permease protein
MRRLLRIAGREYLAYVRTPGFWLSILLLPVGLSILFLAPMLLDRSTPAPTLAVVDLTGRSLAPAVTRALENGGPSGDLIVRLVAAPGAPFSNPADAAARLKPYLAGRRVIAGGDRLDAVAILRPGDGEVAIDFWSRAIADRGVEHAVSRAVTRALRRQALAHAGVDPATLAGIDALDAPVTDFSPRAALGKVALRDRLPGVVGVASGLLLWMVVLTGAGMLLGSIIEEKSSRILEILLSSASVPEIMGGKILGVAGVTFTVMAFWLAIAAGVVGARFPDVAADLVAILLAKGLWAYFTVYFVGGYLMFATLYVTIGAFCESPREAQTLLGPMMILMSVPLVFMSQAMAHPDAPLLTILAFVPPFTPFMMAARVATDPPAWQVAATVALMAAVTALELWIAVPAFKSGALMSGRFELKTFLASLARRGLG